MARMVRKQICIEEDLDRALALQAKSRGVSQGEIVRQALRRELAGGQQGHLTSLWHSIEADLEVRAARGVLPGGRTWRREDAYDD